MKKMKKVVAMLLALAMVLGMSLTVFADLVTTPASGKKGDTAEISVGGLSTDVKDAGMEAYAYQIVKATYEGEDESGTFTGYEALYDEIKLPEPGGSVSINEAQLTAILDKITETTPKIKMNIAGGVATADVEVGSYLVVIKNAETKVYSPVVVSAYYANKDGQNAITSDQIANIATEQAWIKVTDTPKVDKWIVEADGDKKGNSVKIGDTIDYKIEVGPIPYYGGTYPTLNLVDTMDNGLDRVTALEDVKVSIAGKYLTKDIDYTIEEAEGNARQIIINFVVNDKYTLNEYAANPENKIKVEYQARINKDATMNQIANKNDVVLNYTKDSKLQGNDDEDEDIVYSYTFDIDAAVEGSITNRVVDKKGVETDEVEGSDGVKGLNGAKFGLYTDENCTTLWTNDETGFDGIVETKNGGQMPIYGLKAGTYYLKETEAPAGYSLNTDIYKIEITATYTTSTVKKEAGKLASWEIKINNETMADSTGKKSIFTIDNGTAEGATKVIDTTDILNTKLTSLPSTGGIGTTIFTIGGCLIMIIAAGLFFASRKKSAK